MAQQSQQQENSKEGFPTPPSPGSFITDLDQGLSSAPSSFLRYRKQAHIFFLSVTAKTFSRET